MPALLPLYLAACLFVTTWNILHSQKLYDNDCNQCDIFNQDRKITALQSALEDTETLTREETARLEKAVKSSKDAYNDLLKMYGSKIFPTDITIEEMCKQHPDLIIGSTTDCHRYYNCSGEDPALSGWIDPYKFWPTKYLHECHYPFLFSETTLQCENYTKVACGTRYKPTWACKYFRPRCKLSHCIPCGYRYSKCEYKADGLWPDPDAGFSSLYIVCGNGQENATGRCPVDEVWNVQSFPYNGTCVHLFGIPTEFNSTGRLPSCKGTPNGNYQFPERPCDAYYRCEDGYAQAVKCTAGTVFDKVSKTCEVNGTCF